MNHKSNYDFSGYLNRKNVFKDFIKAVLEHDIEVERQKRIATAMDLIYAKTINSVKLILKKHRIKNPEKYMAEIHTEFAKSFKTFSEDLEKEFQQEK